MARYLLLLICLMVLALAGCGGGAESAKQADEAPAAGVPPEMADAPEGQPQAQAAAEELYPAAELDDSPVVATVNGVPIIRYIFEAQVAMTTAERMKFGIESEDPAQRAKDDQALRLGVLNNLVSLELACQEAISLGYAPSSQDLNSAFENLKKEYDNPEDLKSVLALHGDTEDDLREQLTKTMAFKKWQEDSFLAEIKVSPEEARDFYDQHQDMLRHGAAVRVSQIVVNQPLLAQQEDQKAKSRAKAELIGQLLEAGEDFNYLAAEMSDDDEAKKKMGDMGWLERGQVLAVFDQAIFSLKIGETSRMIESPLGYHYFKVFDARPAGVASFSEARSAIVAHLSGLKLERVFTEKMVDLYGRANIEILDAPLKRDYDDFMAKAGDFSASAAEEAK